MSAHNHKNSIKKLVALIGVASASVFLSVPALALINSKSSSFDGSLKNRTLNAESSEGSRQLLAQGTSGTGGTGTGGTGAGGAGTGQTGTGDTGAGGTGTGGAGTGQTGAGGTGTGGAGTGQTGAGGMGTGGAGTGQTGTGGMGTGGMGTGGTGQTGTGQTGTGQTGTGQTGTGQTGTGQTASFVQLMRAGYGATQQRDYQTALSYFQQALQLRPNNRYARQAVSNVQGYLQRDGQRGTNTTPANQNSR